MSINIPAGPFDKLEHILAIRLDNIGDVIMLGPSLRALRQAYPAAQITLMASPAGSQVAPLLPWVDDVITWRAVWQDIAKNVAVEPEKEYALVELLAQRKFDAAFIFTSFSQSPHPPAYACYLAGIPVRVGQSKEFGGGLLSHWVKPLSDTQYQVERNLHLLRSTGIPVQSEHLELAVQAADQRTADDLLARAGVGEGEPFIVLAPGASAAARRYDEARFAEAIRLLTEQASLPVVLVGSPRESGKFPALEALAGQNPRVISLIGQTSVPEMAAVIRRSALVIANNSGSLHIAAAFQRPVVLLYSGTETMEQWVPHTGSLRILNRPTDCTPCYSFQCPYHMECLDIPPSEVADAVLDLLKADDSLSNALIHPFSGHTRR